MPQFKVKVKWAKELYPDLDLDASESPLLFKAQLFALTGVEPHRQKLMLKGSTIKDDDGGWDGVKLRDGATLLMMGTKEENMPSKPVEKTKFVEDMDESELNSAMDMPAGLQNLGNTCYMNATVQCLKTVPEFRVALDKFGESVSFDGSASFPQSITAALRDLYKSMDKGQNMPPLVLLQVLHNAFPRFAEKSEHGGFQQQDANECWIELLNMLKQKLSSDGNDKVLSAIDQYFGLDFDTKTKCVESEEEEVTTSKEHFLQYNCYIDKDVKYLHTGLMNRLQESLTKTSPTLDREAEYVKTLKVSRLPGYLTVQMVRFQFKQKDSEGINAKILKDIKFPKMLDTFDTCSDELKQKLMPMRKKYLDYEDYLVEHNVAKVKSKGRETALKESLEEDSNGVHEEYSFEDDPGSNNSGYYTLQAILTHKGRSSNSGHYVAWVKQKGDTWIECNDDDVRPIHEEDIMKLSGGGDWHTAYLLLYGPRRLPKYEKEEKKEEEKKSDTAKADNNGSSATEKMETS